MFPNERIASYYQQCQAFLSFSDISWWLIDLEHDPGVFYCNDTMCETFSLDKSITAHSVSKNFPIAGDYNQNIAIRNT
jgi:hypothetical protein